jgi:hypothetical protein
MVEEVRAGNLDEEFHLAVGLGISYRIENHAYLFNLGWGKLPAMRVKYSNCISLRLFSSTITQRRRQF